MSSVLASLTLFGLGSVAWTACDWLLARPARGGGQMAHGAQTLPAFRVALVIDSDSWVGQDAFVAVEALARHLDDLGLVSQWAGSNAAEGAGRVIARLRLTPTGCQVATTGQTDQEWRYCGPSFLNWQPGDAVLEVACAILLAASGNPNCLDADVERLANRISDSTAVHDGKMPLRDALLRISRTHLALRSGEVVRQKAAYLESRCWPEPPPGAWRCCALQQEALLSLAVARSGSVPAIYRGLDALRRLRCVTSEPAQNLDGIEVKLREFLCTDRRSEAEDLPPAAPPRATEHAARQHQQLVSL